ncbi:hypothetical protein D1BOALGB6SA_9884 [Olavius sp. associated proteobacterium Delta 1]|nr:hypothetical protein D1BOALGB6SA_9884 [Olavius sp. associated proteobacterium Delta 1]
MSPDHFDIIYYCDSHPAIGLGHLKRGIDILNSLHRKDKDLSMAMCGSYSESARLFMENMLNHDTRVFAKESYSDELSCQLGIVDTMFDDQNPEYIDRQTCEILKAKAEKLILICGILKARLPDCVNVFINHLPDVKIQGNKICKKYLGFDYIPVAEEFFAQIDPALSAPDFTLAIIGGNDEQTGPELLLKGLKLLQLDMSRFNVVVSPHYPTQMTRILKKQYPQVAILQNLPQLKPYIQKASAVICTYGHTTFECMSLGKPTFLLNYKSFQNLYSDYLADKNLAVNLGYFNRIKPNKLESIQSIKTLQTLGENCRRTFRSPGIENIVTVIQREMEHVSN